MVLLPLICALVRHFTISALPRIRTSAEFVGLGEIILPDTSPCSFFSKQMVPAAWGLIATFNTYSIYTMFRPGLVSIICKVKDFLLTLLTLL